MNIRKIFCPTDFSTPAHEAMLVALDLAVDHSAELLLAHVVDYLPPLLGGGSDPVSQYHEHCQQMEKEAGKKLEQLAKKVIPAKVKFKILVRCGHPAIQIVEWIKTEQADVIVIATHGLTGWRPAFLGSVTARILLLTKCPVWIVHPRPAVRQSAGRHS